MKHGDEAIESLKKHADDDGIFRWMPAPHYARASSQQNTGVHNGYWLKNTVEVSENEIKTLVNDGKIDGATVKRSYWGGSDRRSGKYNGLIQDTPFRAKTPEVVKEVYFHD